MSHPHAGRSSQTISSREDRGAESSENQALNIVERYRRGSISKAAAVLTIQRDLAPILELSEKTIDEALPSYLEMLKHGESSAGPHQRASLASSIGPKVRNLSEKSEVRPMVIEDRRIPLIQWMGMTNPQSKGLVPLSTRIGSPC